MSSSTTCNVRKVPLDRPRLDHVVYPAHEPRLTIDPSDGDDGITVCRRTWFPFATTRLHRLWYFHARAVTTLAVGLTPKQLEQYPPRETYPPDAYESSQVKFRHTAVGKTNEVFTVAYAVKRRRGWEYRAATLTFQASYQAVGLIGQHWGVAEILGVIHNPPHGGDDYDRHGIFFVIEQVTRATAVNPYHFVGQLSYEALNTIDRRNPVTLKPLADLAETHGPDARLTSVVNLIFGEFLERDRQTTIAAL